MPICRFTKCSLIRKGSKVVLAGSTNSILRGMSSFIAYKDDEMEHLESSPDIKQRLIVIYRDDDTIRAYHEEKQIGFIEVVCVEHEEYYPGNLYKLHYMSMQTIKKLELQCKS